MNKWLALVLAVLAGSGLYVLVFGDPAARLAIFLALLSVSGLLFLVADDISLSGKHGSEEGAKAGRLLHGRERKDPPHHQKECSPRSRLRRKDPPREV